MKRVFILVAFSLFISAATPVVAEELVFRFINPSFGGNPMNGNWIMSYVAAQNKFAYKPDLSNLTAVIVPGSGDGETNDGATSVDSLYGDNNSDIETMVPND